MSSRSLKNLPPDLARPPGPCYHFHDIVQPLGIWNSAMARKEKVTIIRSEDFASVEDELSAALEQLENANTRVLDLLASETAPVGEERLVETPTMADAPPGGDADAAQAS